MIIDWCGAAINAGKALSFITKTVYPVVGHLHWTVALSEPSGIIKLLNTLQQHLAKNKCNEASRLITAAVSKKHDYLGKYVPYVL